MSSVIRPLTLSERKRPAQLTYLGGFKNVSFQIGEIVLPESVSRNTNNVTALYAKAVVRKGPNVQFPIMVPNALGVLKGMTNTVASVIGQKNLYDGFDAILVARSTERLSSFNSKLRTVEDLIKTAEVKPVAVEEAARLGKSSNARIHNQVMLAGVVVGAHFEDGESPRFHILLRQDANPNNVIPLTYEARNASAMVSRVKYGSLIYVDGEYAFRSLPVYQMDDMGNVVLDADKKPVVAVDPAGKPLKRIHTYIRITSPKDPAEFDTDFGGTVPRWVVDIAQVIALSRVRSPALVAVVNTVVGAGDAKVVAVANEASSIDSL